MHLNLCLPNYQSSGPHLHLRLGYRGSADRDSCTLLYSAASAWGVIVKSCMRVHYYYEIVCITGAAELAI